MLFLASLAVPDALYGQTMLVDERHSAKKACGNAGMRDGGTTGMWECTDAGMQQDDTSPPRPARESSGTSWIPDASHMNGVDIRAGAWNLMLHGQANLQWLAESGSPHYGSHGGGSINWFMADAERPVGAGRFILRSMLSAEAWTLPRCGYPDLLATGELCDGDSIHDRQHPHDVFMELSAAYDRPTAGSTRLRIYGGPSGEPALGPPAYLHRPSSGGNPIAPIAHHWLDSTHISFGVLTGAVYGDRWKADASVFNGREPDERRTNIDLDRLDSFSGRLSMNPTPRIALQVSAGHLHDAEAGLGTQPRRDVNRITASAIVLRTAGTAGTWATTLAYGLRWGLSNVAADVIEQTTHAGLLETSYSSSRASTWFGRFELVGKPAHDLHADEFSPAVFTVAKLQAGYVRYLSTALGVRTGLGGTFSLSLLPPLLAPRYEGRVAPGGGVFVSIEPAGTHGDHTMMHAH